MALKSSFPNMLLSLGTICLVCSALLGAVYGITKDPISAAETAKVNAAISEVVPQFDNDPSASAFEVGEAVVYPATLSGEAVGYAVKVSSSGFGGALQIMVGFTPDGVVYNTSVISHSETPGLGAKIVDPACPPRAQIVGKNPGSDKILVSKDGGAIDAITASTITSRAFLAGVAAAYEVFLKIDGNE